MLIQRSMPLTAEIDALGNRKRKTMQPSEAQVQRAIIQRFQLSGILAVHVPMEGRRSDWERMQLKRDGAMIGFPDLLLYAPNGRHGLLEIKRPGWKAPREPRPGTKPTAAWNAWAARLTVYEALTSRGHPVAVVTSVDEAVAAVKGWGWL